MCLGPIAVLPARQGQGIGSLLMNYSLGKARSLGYPAVILFGNPDYYQRFGFISAEKYGIQTSSGENFEEFMALELYGGGLQGISGRFKEDEVFKIEKDELEVFEKQFPYKKKLVTDTQLK